MKVKKRDGSIVNFDGSKISNAIGAANKAVSKPERATAIEKKEIIKYIKSLKQDIMSVEEIQDIIENKLMEFNHYELAKKYILYREERTKIRNKNSQLMKDISKKIEASDVQNQNANVDEHSFGGRTGEASSVMTKRLALDHLISDMARENHLNNEIYIHDLDAYYVGSHNCLSIPFDDLLAKGFNTRQTDVRQAGSVNTACQLVAVIFQLQSLQQFGGVSATHLDWTMVPYVRKSFWKHFKDGVHYCQNDKLIGLSGIYEKFEGTEEAIDERRELNTSIDDKWAVRNKLAYDYAIDMTEREIH